jgi:putative nucleotide binding protein
MRLKRREQKPNFRKKTSSVKKRGLGEAFVLDYYPQGKSLSQKNSQSFNPLIVVITSNKFQFFDVILNKGRKIEVGELIDVSQKGLERSVMKEIGYNELSDSAVDFLPEAIKKIVKKSESRFVNFLNSAQPVTTQMHRLQLLPGIGNKRLWQILEARKKTKFLDFNDFTVRTGISDPLGLFVNRILQEIKGTERYHIFTQKRN